MRPWGVYFSSEFGPSTRAILLLERCCTLKGNCLMKSKLAANAASFARVDTTGRRLTIAVRRQDLGIDGRKHHVIGMRRQACGDAGEEGPASASLRLRAEVVFELTLDACKVAGQWQSHRSKFV